MDWFNTRTTANRATDAERMKAVMVSLKEFKCTLTEANKFVMGQKNRAEQLAVQFSAIDSASNSTGQSLQHAIDDLAHFERDSRSVNDNFSQRLVTLELIIKQYALPPGQRIMSMRESDMADSVIESAAEIMGALSELKIEHMSGVSAAVTRIDLTDFELNGPLCTSAIHLLPDLPGSIEVNWLQS
ncbi:hypothetical protein [Limnobacter parvus]|uniref:Uncharacterized protein n=1 Tax=Limnobacter parvus TaxID=2939690 RepID=A0ABT1XF30_9BURK|nr:hypothetical protein [Limnobacter parvus]MCR2745885.1 hypothetical protein [Limnobacter parvus]